MRIYKLDGTFVDNTNDTDFGWYFSDIIKDSGEDNKEELIESIVIIEPKKPVAVKIVDPRIETEPIVNVLDCKMEIEGISVRASEPKLLKELKNINVTLPSKEKLASLVTPCNTETKALLSVLYFAKYKTLLKREASNELFKTLNYRTTNFNHLINDKEASFRQEMYKEIHATKEDNMLSLMMELILADLDCNLEDIVDVNETANECNLRRSVIETSDLGNSIRSGYSSKDGNSDNSDYLLMPARADNLSSVGGVGLGEDQKSLRRSVSEDMLQLAGIKESFLNEELRVTDLIKIAVALEKELKETLYLDDILHLLKGDIEKVTFKKLPFRIFHSKGKSKQDDELNLII